MTSRIKIMTLVGFAALALSAWAAGTASAEHMWFVGGSLLQTTAAIESLLPVDGSPTLRFTNAGTTVKVACPGVVHLENGLITKPDVISASRILFLSCSVVEPATCSLEAPEIETTSIVGLASLSKVTFKPKTGTLFATLAFTGAQCSLGQTPVKGQVTFGVASIANEQAVHLIEALGSVENNSLEVGTGNKGFIEGGSLLALLEGSPKWSFHA